MRNQAESAESWVALSRLLLKLQIIDEDSYAKNLEKPQGIDSNGPIAFGASIGLFDEWDAVQLVADKLGIKSISITKQNLVTFARAIDDEVLQRISLEQWKEFRAIPLGRTRGVLSVALANPLARHVKQAIDFALGESTQLAIAEESQILNVLTRRVTVAHEDSFVALPESEPTDRPTLSAVGATESFISTSDVEAPPVVRLVNKVFLDAFERGASDIHVSPEKDQLIVRIRADGLMSDLISVPSNLSAGVLSRMKLLAGMDISEKRRPQDGRLRIQVGSSHRDLRVSTVPTLYGENLVARILNSDPSHLSFKSLGMPEHTLAQIMNDLSGTSQVVLITGPTGSGKTSTLYAGIMHLKDGLHNIITIEDPIEYRVAGITQIQVNQKIGMTFADTLRSVLRQDPDVVVVGEIRDGETASIAMQVAQTGHVVLATLHTNSASAAITRLRDLGIPPYLIASSLKGVLAQRLVRRLCGSCAAPDVRERTSSLLGSHASPSTPLAAVGCDDCGGTGYSGRVGVYSYLHVSDDVRQVIRDNSAQENIEENARSTGFATLEEAGLDLVRSGKTSLDEVLRVVGPIELPSLNQTNSTKVVQTVTNPKDSGPIEVKQDAPQSQMERSRPRKKRILLVEDDENMRVVLVMLLERAMYDVVEAENGVDALEQVFASPPDLIMCDLMMPKMDGAETVQILRRDPTTRQIPVLMLTAADTMENEVRLLQCGADDFVSKTSDQRVLLSRVERLLQRSES